MSDEKISILKTPKRNKSCIVTLKEIKQNWAATYSANRKKQNNYAYCMQAQHRLRLCYHYVYLSTPIHPDHLT